MEFDWKIVGLDCKNYGAPLVNLSERCITKSKTKKKAKKKKKLKNLVMLNYFLTI